MPVYTDAVMIGVSNLIEGSLNIDFIIELFVFDIILNTLLNFLRE